MALHVKQKKGSSRRDAAQWQLQTGKRATRFAFIAVLLLLAIIGASYFLGDLADRLTNPMASRRSVEQSSPAVASHESSQVKQSGSAANASPQAVKPAAIKPPAVKLPKENSVERTETFRAKPVSGLPAIAANSNKIHKIIEDKGKPAPAATISKSPQAIGIRGVSAKSVERQQNPERATKKYVRPSPNESFSIGKIPTQ